MENRRSPFVLDKAVLSFLAPLSLREEKMQTICYVKSVFRVLVHARASSKAFHLSLLLIGGLFSIPRDLGPRKEPDPVTQERPALSAPPGNVFD